MYVVGFYMGAFLGGDFRIENVYCTCTMQLPIFITWYAQNYCISYVPAGVYYVVVPN